MISETQTRKLFKDYINGECDPAAVKRVLSLLATQQGEKIYRELLEMDDEELADQQIEPETKESLYDSIVQSIEHTKNSNRIPLDGHFIKYAAAIILLVAASIILYRYSTKLENTFFAPVQKQVITQGNQRSEEIVLPDGTKVWLNQKSTLRFPETFSGETRKVSLDGEAFFDVAHNPLKPFIIQSGDVTTTVLGTTFNVSNYSDKEESVISLVEGKVRITTAYTKTELTPGKEIIIKKGSQDNVVQAFDEELTTAWVDGKIVFKHTRLDSALMEISDWYDQPIMLSHPVSNQCRVTSTFKQQNISSVIKSLSYSMDFQYKIKNDTLWIDNKACK